jgi:hypothetical protein
MDGSLTRAGLILASTAALAIAAAPTAQAAGDDSGKQRFVVTFDTTGQARHRSVPSARSRGRPTVRSRTAT